MKSDARVAYAALMLFLVLGAAYVFSIDMRASRGAQITGDEPFYLLTTQSLLQDRDLDLTQQYERRSYEGFFDHPTGLWRQSAPAADGRLLSPHNPGLSVLLIPGFAFGGLRGAQAQLVVLAALTFALAFIFAARLTHEIRLSWLMTLAVGLSPTAFVYANEIYPEVPAALALVTALLMVSRHRNSGPLAAVALVALLSAMPWLGIKYAPLILIVSAYGLWRATPAGRATILALGVMSAAVYAGFHLRAFGALTPYSVGLVYAGDSTAEVIARHVLFLERMYRLWGLFIDERFGVARWAPLLVLAVPGLGLLWRGGALARLVIGVVIVQLLMATFVHITMMGWWFPGRTLMVVLPLFIVPLVFVARSARGWWGWGVGILAGYTFAVTASLALASRRGEVTIAVDPFGMSAPLFQKMAWLFPNYTWWDGETWALTIAWVAAMVLAIAVAARPFHIERVVARRLVLRPDPDSQAGRASARKRSVSSA